MFGRNSFATLPRGNATALQEKKAQQKKSGEILFHLCLDVPFLLRAAHDDYSFCTRSAPHFYERWTSAERRKGVAGTCPWVILFIKKWTHPIHVAPIIFHGAILPLPYFQIICLSPSNSYRPKTPLKKYVNINGKVSKDKWQSMFRYFAKYVKTLFSG